MFCFSLLWSRNQSIIPRALGCFLSFSYLLLLERQILASHIVRCNVLNGHTVVGNATRAINSGISCILRGQFNLQSFLMLVATKLFVYAKYNYWMILTLICTLLCRIHTFLMKVFYCNSMSYMWGPPNFGLYFGTYLVCIHNFTFNQHIVIGSSFSSQSIVQHNGFPKYS